MTQETAREEQPSFDALLRENRDYQSAFDRKVDKALQTARANWEREEETARETVRSQALAEARSAAETEFRARMEELAAHEADYRRRERQVEVAARLTELGLPGTFAPWLTGETAEESLDRVTAFAGAFCTAVGNGVTARLGGVPPVEPVSAPAFDRQQIRSMTPREINAHWAEIQNTLKG